MGRDPISSPRNQRVAYARSLASASVRRSERQTIIEGPAALAAAVGASADVVEVFALEGDATPDDLGLGDRAITVTRPVLEAISDTRSPRGPIAIVTIVEAGPLEQRDTLVLHEVGDPGNAGTLMRTAAAFGFQVATTPGTVDLWSPKVMRSAAGAHWATRLSSLADGIADLDAAGLAVVATAVRGGVGPNEAFATERPIALLVGNEPHGLPAHVVAASWRTLTLPMAGDVESLNVAIAGSIALYELGTRRGLGTGGSG
jgi:RNA methyltransferase, TrmH family